MRYFHFKSFSFLLELNQFHNRSIKHITRTMLISASGGRFPRARLQPPRRLLLRGLQLALFPQESPPTATINVSDSTH